MNPGGERATTVFLDSRCTLIDGSLEIPGGGLLLDPNDRRWFGEFSTATSWDTIDETNNVLHVIEEPARGVEYHRAILLKQSPHDLDSLAAVTQTDLTGAGNAARFGTYSVTWVSTGTGGATLRAYQVSCSVGEFRLPSDWQIRLRCFSNSPSAVANSTNALAAFPAGDYGAISHKSGFIDLRRVHSVFVHSSGFGSYKWAGTQGTRNVLAKEPADVGYGGAVRWHMSGSERDSIEIRVHSLTVLQIKPKDVAGKMIDV